MACYQQILLKYYILDCISFQKNQYLDLISENNLKKIQTDCQKFLGSMVIILKTSPLRKYHSVGFFGEQALESLHQIMHKDEVKFVHLNKQPVTKIKLCCDQQNIRALLN